MSLHSSHAQRASSRNFKLTQNQSQTNFSATIIIRSSLDANSVSERGLQSQLVNNYDRILKPALESKRNVESTRLLEGMEVHTERGELPASKTWRRESQRVPRYKWILDISSRSWSRTSGCHKRWWLHISAEHSAPDTARSRLQSHGIGFMQKKLSQSSEESSRDPLVFRLPCQDHQQRCKTVAFQRALTCQN